MSGVETPEYASMLSRMIRAYAKRVGDGDPVDLARMVQMSAQLDAAVDAAAQAQHAEGFSWGEIAEALGMSRQAAWQRFGRAG